MDISNTRFGGRVVGGVVKDPAQIDLTQSTPRMDINVPFSGIIPEIAAESSLLAKQNVLIQQLQLLFFDHGIRMTLRDTEAILNAFITQSLGANPLVSPERLSTMPLMPQQLISNNMVMLTPTAEVVDRKQAWAVMLELYNVNPKNIKIERFQDKLIVRAKQTNQLDGAEKMNAEDVTLLNELPRCQSQFYREIKLGFVPKSNSIQSQFKNGILEIVIQKPANSDEYEDVPVR